MKINIEIECSPAEARAFLGLPDVVPMQAELMARLQERMAASFDGMSPEALLKSWFPSGLQEMGNLQKMFWSQFGGAATDPDRK